MSPQACVYKDGHAGCSRDQGASGAGVGAGDDYAANIARAAVTNCSLHAVPEGNGQRCLNSSWPFHLDTAIYKY